MDLFHRAIQLAPKRLKASSQAVYASMWHAFETRLTEQGFVPGSESAQALALAIAQAGSYPTQRRLFRLVQWVYQVARDHGDELTDHTPRLQRLYRADERPAREGLAPEALAALPDRALVLLPGWKGVRLAAIVAVLVQTGLRQQELLALKRTALFWSEDGSALLSVGRGAKARTLEVPAVTATWVRQWLAVSPAPETSPWLFVADGAGERMNTVTLWRQLKRLSLQTLGEAGAAGFGSGLIRASWAKAQQSDGASASEVRSRLGHKAESSTAELLERTRLRTLPLREP